MSGRNYEVGVQGGSYETIGGFFDFGGTLGEQSDFAYRLTGLGASKTSRNTWRAFGRTTLSRRARRSNGSGSGAGVRCVGQRYGNSANTFNLDSVVLADFALSFKKNGYKASLNVQNVFDKDYVASCSAFGCYYGDGRTFMGKLTYSW
ncbi:TonB-dependent receptor [Ensifer canadensis]|uniref:TonB-dependent receptor n=1 Tax=Ensifer canadensis TaxID=555315 RepID=UPI00148FF945|nr:TonB-dependent receptor [Ensifer canadensis]